MGRVAPFPFTNTKTRDSSERLGLWTASLAIWLLVFRDPLTNKLVFVLLCALFVWVCSRRNSNQTSDRHTLTVGCFLFGCRSLALILIGETTPSAFMAEIISPFANCVVLFFIMTRVATNIRAVYFLALQYAYARAVECAVFGLVGEVIPDWIDNLRPAIVNYSSYDDSLSQASLVDASRDVDRLIGLFSCNAVEVASVLCIVLAILGGSLIVKFSFARLAFLAVCVVACAMTWSRTGVMGMVIISFLYMILLRRGNLISAGIVAIVASLMFTWFYAFIVDRLSNDDRLRSSETVDIRLEVQSAYLKNLKSAGPFGIGLPLERLAAVVVPEFGISSESAYIGAFFSAGWLGGIGFLVVVVRAICLSVAGLRIGINGRESLAFISMRAIPMVALFTFAVLISTYYYLWSSFDIWFLASLAFVTSQIPASSVR